MQNFGAKSVKLHFWGKMITNENFHCSCDLTHDSSRKTTRDLEFNGILSFYKILKIFIFGKLTGGLENFL